MHVDVAGAAPVNAVETVVASFGPLAAGAIAGEPPAAPNIPQIIRGVLNILTGATTTAIVVRIRQGVNTITGALVQTADTHTIGAAASANVAFEKADTSALAGSTGYSITVQQTGGTSNGAVNISADCVNFQ